MGFVDFWLENLRKLVTWLETSSFQGNIMNMNGYFWEDFSGRQFRLQLQYGVGY
jgi:hypothetical protein